VARSITTATAQRRSHEPLYEADPRTGESIEVFYADAGLAKSLGSSTGWYWWTCRIGSVPDCSPKGPFATSYLAYRDAASPWFVED
jgi:hypothetical protein